MALAQKRRAICEFINRIDAELALGQLNSAGFPMAQISIDTKDTDDNSQLDRAEINDHTRVIQARNATSATIAGSLLGAIGGCLVGIGILAMPGVIPVLALGTSGTAVTTTLAGAGIGAVSCAFIEALVNLGMASKGDSAWQGDYLVIVNGTDDEVRHAESILSEWSNSSP